MFWWTVFQIDSFSSGDGSSVSSVSPFSSSDLGFINQSGGTNYWRHVRQSIFNQHIKELNPNYIFHHHDITFFNSNKTNFKGEIPKNQDYQNMVMESG